MYLVSDVHRTTYWEILHPDWLRQHNQLVDELQRNNPDWLRQHNQLVDEGSVTQNLNQQFAG